MQIPAGYDFATAQAGFKKPGRKDLGCIVSHVPASAAGVFTKNLFQAAPVLVSREAVETRDTARAVVMNSGQANACTGDAGVADCRRTLELVGRALDLDPVDILPASTGVIGVRMDLGKWEAALGELAATRGKAEAEDFARAIMTTDTFPKLASAEITVRGKAVRVLGMAKGAGMICPDMATMLGVVITDAGVAPEDWSALLRHAVRESFNKVTVDGDTSTNDTVFGLANGVSGVDFSSDDLALLRDAMTEVCRDLAYLVVQDAEGGTKVLRIRITGAEDAAQAELAARAVGHSPLVKTALYGKDANWGRIVAALGRSGAAFDPMRVDVRVGGVAIFLQGAPCEEDLDAALAPVLDKQDVDIDITLGHGPGAYELLASDLTHDYISINADYRT